MSDAEILSVWAAAESLGSFGGLVQFALLTGLRRGELAGLRWSHIKPDRIVLEAQQTKSGVIHEVPMTELMRTVLEWQPLISATLVFPSSNANTRISGWTQLVRKLVLISGVSFTMHDLRRTCRTLMSRIEVPEDIAELAIGHQRVDLVARYNRDQAWPRRVDAFKRVSMHVSKILGGATDNVVAMTRRF